MSENQAQPMLKFQEDVDEETGEQVLTCFLLPQQAYHTESMGMNRPTAGSLTVSVFLFLIVSECLCLSHCL